MPSEAWECPICENSNAPAFDHRDCLDHYLDACNRMAAETDRLRAALETAERRISDAIGQCGEVETRADHPPCGVWDCMTCIHRPIIETLQGAADA